LLLHRFRLYRFLFDLVQQERDMFRLILMIAGLWLAAAPPVFAEKSRPLGDREDWQVVYLSGQRVGYSSSSTHTVEREGKKVLVSDTLMVMAIKRFGITLKMTVRQSSEEDPETGRLLKVNFVSDNPPVSKTELNGVAEGDEMVISVKNGAKTTQSRMKIEEDVKSSAWQERYLEEHPLKPGDTASFKIFSPESAKIATVTLQQKDDEETKLLDGSMKKLQKTVMLNSLTPGISATVYSDAEGELVKMETNVLGMAMYAVTKEKALEEIPNTELDVGLDGLLKVTIQDPHHANSITYRVKSTSANLSNLFADGEGQSVKKISDGEIELTVQRTDGTKAEAPGSEYLGTSIYLDLDDPKVKALGEEFKVGATPEATARGLAKFVHSRVKNKTFSVAMGTASDVARDLTGDCTEHSVLLAALLREKKIPSRVVVGLVYADSLKAFGGHMWTEAYVDGRWIPLDSAMNIDPVRSGHLKIADSSLAENSPAPVTEFVKLIHLWTGTKIEVISRK
jgi:hypothetical protein